MSENSSGKSFTLFGSVFTVLGVLMGTASLISLFQRWTGVEIVAEIARDALSIYRQMMEQFHWALFSWWTPLELPWGWAFSMPAWGMDLLAVWFLFALGYVRGVYVGHSAYLFALDHPVQEQLDALIRESTGSDEASSGSRGNEDQQIRTLPWWIPLKAFFLTPRAVWHLIESNGGAIAKLSGPALFADEPLIRTLARLHLRHAMLSFLAMIAPIAATMVFFAWNAIQISPQ